MLISESGRIEMILKKLLMEVLSTTVASKILLKGYLDDLVFNSPGRGLNNGNVTDLLAD